MKANLSTAPFCDGAFLFPVAASLKPRRNLPDSFSRSILGSEGKYQKNKSRHIDFAALLLEGGGL